MGLHTSFTGQSAIEYLMTYGWMLLVVAVAGGAVFSVVGDQTIRSSNGFTGSDIDITNFGLTQQNELGAILQNTAPDNVEIKKITLRQGSQEIVTSVQKNIESGESISVSALGVADSSRSNTINVQVTYDTGSLENLTLQGSLIGSLEVDADRAAPNENWAFVDVSKVNQSTVDTTEMGDFYIMKYEASAASNISEPSTSATPVSRKGHIPWTQINQNEAINVCQDAGYELPTNKEWQAATMAEIGNSSTQPLGNNDYGQAVEDGSKGTPSGYYNATLTGSGPDSWSNNLDIADMHGNIWELTNDFYGQGSEADLGESGNVSSWNSEIALPDAVGGSDKFGNDKYIYPNDAGDGALIRGGSWRYGDGRHGVFSVSLTETPSERHRFIGFRCSLS